MAVAVVVKEGTAVPPGFAGTGDASSFAYIAEGAVAIVVIEDVFPVVGDVKILEAVVVVVADADALAPTSVSKAGLSRNVGKSAVLIVVVAFSAISVKCATGLASGFGD